MPTNGVDTRVYYNYQKRDNESTQVVFGPGPLDCDGPCTNLLYTYERWNVGFDAYWRFTKGQRVGGGFEYLHQDQNRPDYDEIEDTKFFLEYKNTMVDGLAARLKYTYLDRDSHFLLGNEGANANDVLFLERFIGRFDLQPVERHELKLNLDWTPSPLFDFSLEATWKDNDYKRSGASIVYESPSPTGEFLGRTKDERQEIYLSASFGDASKLRATAFYDIEWIKYDGFHRNIGAAPARPPPAAAVTATDCFDPNTPPNSVAYNWSSRNKDRNWLAGIGVDWPALPNLLVKASYLYVKTDGKADISAQNNFGNPLPITAYDDTKTQSFNLKAIWDVNKSWQVTGGLRLREVRVQRRPVQRLPVHDPVPGGVEQRVAVLPERLQRVHELQVQHLLRARDLSVLTRARPALAAGDAFRACSRRARSGVDSRPSARSRSHGAAAPDRRGSRR